jgi:hypothetical protein
LCGLGIWRDFGGHETPLLVELACEADFPNWAATTQKLTKKVDARLPSCVHMDPPVFSGSAKSQAWLAFGRKTHAAFYFDLLPVWLP